MCIYLEVSQKIKRGLSSSAESQVSSSSSQFNRPCFLEHSKATHRTATTKREENVFARWALGYTQSFIHLFLFYSIQFRQAAARASLIPNLHDIVESRTHTVFIHHKATLLKKKQKLLVLSCLYPPGVGNPSVMLSPIGIMPIDSPSIDTGLVRTGPLPPLAPPTDGAGEVTRFPRTIFTPS